jgi:hypothetical protein
LRVEWVRRAGVVSAPCRVALTTRLNEGPVNIQMAALGKNPSSIRHLHLRKSHSTLLIWAPRPSLTLVRFISAIIVSHFRCSLDSTWAFRSPLHRRDNRNHSTHIPADLRNPAELIVCLRATSLSFAASPPQQPPWTADTRPLGRRPSTRCPLTATLTTRPRLARRAIALLCACSPQWKSPMTLGRMSYHRFLSLPLFRSPLFRSSRSSQCT